MQANVRSSRMLGARLKHNSDQLLEVNCSVITKLHDVGPFVRVESTHISDHV
jgi:hypothetical protein